MKIRSRINLIMDLIGLEQLELFALELNNCYILLCLHSSIYKYQSISTKLGQNIYDHKISDELIMDLIRPEGPELFALEWKKLLFFTLFTLKHLQILTSQHQTLSKCI